jgi:hypothetical protein
MISLVIGLKFRTTLVEEVLETNLVPGNLLGALNVTHLILMNVLIGIARNVSSLGQVMILISGILEKPNADATTEPRKTSNTTKAQ